jgi:hypothetical protein
MIEKNAVHLACSWEVAHSENGNKLLLQAFTILNFSSAIQSVLAIASLNKLQIN